MNYSIKNVAGQPLVITLADGSTLRLAIDKTEKVSEELLTDYIKNISEKGLVLLSEVMYSTNTESVDEIDTEKDKEE